MKKTVFTGSGVALVTPFDADGNVNFGKLKELVEFHVKNKTDALIVCGTTGENPTLSDEEHIEVIKKCVEFVSGRIPVIAGTGSNDTSHAVMMSEQAQIFGADALLVVTPYYNKTSQQGLKKHFEFINDRVNLPMILYNVPSRTGVNIEPETYAYLACLENVAGTKEANSDISSVIKTISLCPEDFDIYSGNDDQISAIINLGGKGVISVLANILPKEVHTMAKYGISGKYKKCVEMQKKYLPLCEAMFYDVNPMPVKEAMNLMGFDVGECRLPLCRMNDEKSARLKSVLEEYNLIS